MLKLDLNMYSQCNYDWCLIISVTGAYGYIGGMLGGPVGALTGMSVASIASLGSTIIDNQGSVQPIMSAIAMVG